MIRVTCIADAQKKAISIEHLLTMSAGLEWHELEYPYGDDRNTFRHWSDAGSEIEYVLNLPMVAEPGTEYTYTLKGNVGWRTDHSGRLGGGFRTETYEA